MAVAAAGAREAVVVKTTTLSFIEMKALFFPFCFLLLTLGCSRSIEQNHVLGSYELRKSNASDRLQLASTGVYQHIFMGPDGAERRASDTWRFETVDGEPTVVLKNFKCSAESVNAPGQGYFLMRVTSSWGKCQLWTDADKQKVFFEQIEVGPKP